MTSSSVVVERNLNNVTARFGLWIVTPFLMAMDYGAVIFALITSGFFRGNLLPRIFHFDQDYRFGNPYLFLAIPVVYIALMAFERLYQKRLTFWQTLPLILKVSTYATGIVIGLLYFNYDARNISRLFMLINWFFASIYIAVFRSAAQRLLDRLGLWRKPVVIIGAGETADIVAAAFENNMSLGCRIAGVIKEDAQNSNLTERYPVMGKIGELEAFLTRCSPAEAVIAVSNYSPEQLIELIYRVQPYVPELTLVPNLIGLPVGNLEVETLFDQRAMLLRMRNNLQFVPNILFKRIFDIVTGIVISIFALPLMLLLMLLVHLDSPGPGLFIAKRLGKRGKEFDCYKFRTMYTDGDERLAAYLASNPEAAEEWEQFAKLRRFDPRVTRLGKWLRKYSLDELPQILNVLKGEMTLVGPRPYLPRERERIGVCADTILLCTPGITGLWQVNGRSEVDFQGRTLLDLWYVRNWSFWLDIIILLKTVRVVTEHKGAC